MQIFRYTLHNGAYILQDSIVVDTSVSKEIKIVLTGADRVECNGVNYEVTNGFVMIPVTQKGKLVLRAITLDSKGKITANRPMQPLSAFDIRDTLSCQLAVCADAESYNSRITDLENLTATKEQLTILTDTINSSIELINNINERLTELEKAYDPTLIIQ